MEMTHEHKNETDDFFVKCKEPFRNRGTETVFREAYMHVSKIISFHEILGDYPEFKPKESGCIFYTKNGSVFEAEINIYDLKKIMDNYYSRK